MRSSKLPPALRRLPIALRRLLIALPIIPIALSLLLCLIAQPLHAAPQRLEENRTSYFTVTEERETLERREFNVFTASIDLSQTGFGIETRIVAPTLAERARLEEALIPKNYLMLAGPDGFASVDMVNGKWADGMPNGPLVNQGRWLATPQGAWSAMGIAPDLKPSFATNWLADQPESAFQLWIEAGRAERHPIASVNRPARPNTIAAYTYEFSPERRIVATRADEVIVLLSPTLSSQAAASKPEGIGSPRDWLVYKILEGAATATIDTDVLCLRADGEAAQWLVDRLSRSKEVRTGTRLPGGWSDAREIVGLGQPLVWDGRPMSFNNFAPAARNEVADLREPCRAVVAWFPQKSRLDFIWPQAINQGSPTMSRQAMTARLMSDGARCAFEFGYHAPSPSFFLGEKWIGGVAFASGSWPVPAVLALTKAPEKRSDPRLVNLCRAENAAVSASDTVTGLNPALAVVDSRRDADLGADNFWMGRMPDRASNPVWLEVQLRRARLASRIEIYHAEAAGFSSHYNAVNFRVLARANISDQWLVLGKIENNTDAKTVIDLPAETALRYFRVEIFKPNQFQNNPNARIAEIVVWGK